MHFQYKLQIFGNILVCFLKITVLLANEDVPLNDDRLVETTTGWVRGFTDTAPISGSPEVNCWFGIPYAEPPMDELRFRNPRPKEKWSGVRDAIIKPNSCVQVIDTFFPDFAGAEVWNPKTPLSEDCLFLNIVAPRQKTNLTTMVWIHGGTFTAGSSTLDMYDPRTLAVTEGVIVASIQYRLGPLGFLYFGTEEVPGNAGMFDQLLALQFIKDNIGRFGGREDSITLFGQEAGAVSASLHLLSPLSQDLFTRVILQSGSPLASWAVATKEKATGRSLDLAKALDCPHHTNNDSKLDAVVACLKTKAATDIVAQDGTWKEIIDPFSPVQDGIFLEEMPTETLNKGQFKKENLLLGVNVDEGNYYLLYHLTQLFSLKDNVYIDREDFLQSVRELNPDIPSFGRTAAIFEYTYWTNPHDPIKNRDALNKMVGDKHFVCKASELAARYADDNPYAYYYQFTHRSSKHLWPAWTGAMLGDEINFVFGDPLNPDKKYGDDEVALSRQMMAYWANFAKTGNPSFRSDFTWTKLYWPIYTAYGREVLKLSVNSTKRTETEHGIRVKQCAFWQLYVPELIKLISNYTRPAPCPMSETERSWFQNLVDQLNMWFY